VGLLAGTRWPTVGLLADAFLKMDFLEELFNMALEMKGNELA
jgi:hypothetical protein